jgi:hypothetical protein
MFLNSFSSKTKTRHYNKINAAAWVHNHVANLMIDFNFTKKYYFLHLNAHLNT